jgi:hypothetical protein
MFLSSWLPWFPRHRQGRSRPLRSARAHGRGTRLTLEQLEDRTLLSSYTAATVSDLIADINAANSAGGSNTITLAQKTTFTLTEVNNSTDGGNGLPVIAANDNLTISGNGDIVQRKSSSPLFRIFDVTAGASLTLNDLTLRNGSSNDSGGAIFNNGTLTVGGCTLSGNSAAGGGAIFNQGTLTVSGCTLSGNSAGGGGAIENQGTATVQSSTLSHNSATDGGGIWDHGAGFLTVSDSTITKNSATADGGGINDSGTVFITNNSDVCGNTAAFGDDAFVTGTGGLAISSGSTVCIVFYNAP